MSDLGKAREAERAPKPKMAKCAKCGRMFGTEQGVRDHAQDYHKKEKP